MTVEVEVIHAARERAAALAAGDRDRLLRVLHPRFRWTSHAGAEFDRDAYVAANIGGPTRWHEQRLEDIEVTVVETTAVLRCVVSDDVETASGRAVFRMPVTQTWVRTSSGWQCLAGHAGPRLP